MLKVAQDEAASSLSLLLHVIWSLATCRQLLLLMGQLVVHFMFSGLHLSFTRFPIVLAFSSTCRCNQAMNSPTEFCALFNAARVFSAFSRPCTRESLLCSEQDRFGQEIARAKKYIQDFLLRI